MDRIKKLVDILKLLPHPEGGFYKETYRSDIVVSSSVLGSDFIRDRNYCIAIYFLLTSDNFSAFHRIKQDEIWHFYEGSSLYVHIIDTNGKYKKHTVGLDIENGALPQLVVPAGFWFASSVADQKSYSLVGCTVSPGFDFADFELANRRTLIAEYPQHQDVIERLTR